MGWFHNELITEKEANDIVNFFYSNNGKEIKIICNQILHSIWNDVPYYYRDDFESLAGKLLLICINKYNPSVGDFRGFAYPFMQKKFISHIYSINSLKHGGDGNWDGKKRDKNGKKVKKSVKVKIVNIDDKIKEGSDSTYADVIPGGKSVEDVVFENEKDSRLEVYINRLSRTQREIAELLATGYKPNEIQKLLGLTSKQYFDNLTEMRNPENTSILKGWIQ